MGLDSVEIVMEAEEEFGIKIPDAEAEQIRTVGDLVDLVCQHLAPVTKAPEAQGAAPAPGKSPAVAPAVVSRASVESEVRRIVSGVLGIPLDRVRLDSDLVDDLGAD